MTTPDPMKDHRARMELAQLEARQRREGDLKEQRSPMNTPAVRVAIWERLHQVRMPSDPQHQILLLIAQQTQLAMDDILEVQRARTPA
jgi:hypothetical protein